MRHRFHVLTMSVARLAWAIPIALTSVASSHALGAALTPSSAGGSVTPKTEAAQVEPARPKLEPLKPFLTEAITTAVPIGVDWDVYCSGWLGALTEPTIGTIFNAEKVSSQRIFMPGDIVYLDVGADQGISPGQEFSIVRPGREVYRDREADRGSLGRKYVAVGRLKVLCVLERSSLVEIMTSCREVELGDAVIPFEQIPIPLVRRTAALSACDPPSNKVKGQIVAALDDVTPLGADDIVYLDLGEDAGLIPGDYMTVFRNASGAELLRTVLGEVAILKTTRSTSVAKVRSFRDTILVGDLVELK